MSKYQTHISVKDVKDFCLGLEVPIKSTLYNPKGNKLPNNRVPIMIEIVLVINTFQGGSKETHKKTITSRLVESPVDYISSSSGYLNLNLGDIRESILSNNGIDIVKYEHHIVTTTRLVNGRGGNFIIIERSMHGTASNLKLFKEVFNS